MGCGVLDKGYLKNELTYMPCEWQQVLATQVSQGVCPQ